ncbi:hypothetical protein [Aureispira sp. CCB-E]|uniref:hypothetical protein n=1 Tax=Aureispira sp. CCB-E TaxID=3051121 RepID=UPI0028692D5C|nr:hypothetical protein [Aureispira sp. CCB-E]WMX17463.1 hypothetical protein QP953_13865 [Aureispira sp. CCB-E]
MKAGDFVTVAFTPIERASIEKLSPKNEALLKEIEAAKLVEKGQVYSTISVVVIENGKKVVKLITLLNKLLPTIIEPASEFWEDLVALFAVLPEEIESNGKRYVLWTQPVKGSASDTVAYVWFERNQAKYDILCQTTGHTMFKAKRNMYNFLQDKNYV